MLKLCSLQSYRRREPRCSLNLADPDVLIALANVAPASSAKEPLAASGNRLHPRGRLVFDEAKGTRTSSVLIADHLPRHGWEIIGRRGKCELLAGYI